MSKQEYAISTSLILKINLLDDTKETFHSALRSAHIVFAEHIEQPHSKNSFLAATHLLIPLHDKKSLQSVVLFLNQSF